MFIIICWRLVEIDEKLDIIHIISKYSPLPAIAFWNIVFFSISITWLILDTLTKLDYSNTTFY